jgi:hypothetical protein
MNGFNFTFIMMQLLAIGAPYGFGARKGPSRGSPWTPPYS